MRVFERAKNDILRRAYMVTVVWATRGIDIFFQHSYSSRAPLDSSRLVELKYAIFSRTGSKIKKLRRLKLFLSMVFKHGLLEGSTFLFQYSFITHTKLESCQLGELKYALLAGYDIRLKNESLRKGKKVTFYDRRTWSL